MVYYCFNSSVLFSFSSDSRKKILFKERALSLSLILALFNLILVIPFFFFIEYDLVTSSGLLVLFFKSILGAFAFLFTIKGIKNLDISKALPLLVLTPGLVAFFAFIMLGEPLKLIEIGGMVLLLGGTYILQLRKKEEILEPIKESLKPRGNHYIILALILFTITSILDKAILKNYNVPLNAFMAFQHLFFAIIFTFLAIMYSRNVNLEKSFKLSWKLISTLAVITIIYRYSYLYAVKIAPVALVLSIKRISVFFAVLIGGKLFKDLSLKRRAIATAIMILGAVLIITA